MESTPPSAAKDAETREPRPGEQLRLARERRGLTEVQAAAEMRVDLATLRALESDDYRRLGAPIFVKGHLRNYARLLDLDAEPLLEAYERLAHPSAPALIGYRNEGETVEGTPLREHWPVSWLIIALLAAGVGTWLWNNPLLIPAVDVAAPSALPAEEQAADVQAPPDTAPDAAKLDAPAPTAATDAAPSAASVEPKRDVTEPRREVPTVATPTQTDAEPAASPAPATTDGNLRVQMRFSGESWVEVYDADGNPLVYELYDAGRSRTVNARPPLRVFLGQVNAVTFSVDGRRLDLAPHAKRDGTARFTLAAGGEVR